MIENNIITPDNKASFYEPIHFLLKKGANPHIMDLNSEDACDKAKRNGLAVFLPQFNNCSPKLKKRPEVRTVMDDPMFNGNPLSTLRLAKERSIIYGGGSPSNKRSTFRRIESKDVSEFILPIK